MYPLNFQDIREYINGFLADFYQLRLETLAELTLDKLLKRNPHPFSVKSGLAGDLIEGLLEVFLLSQEEKILQDYWRGLAVLVAGQTCGGHQSVTPGVDLEFVNETVHYLMVIKPNLNWANLSQQKQLERILRDAVIRIRQSRSTLNIQPVLGIAHGNLKEHHQNGYMQVVGEGFWYLISEDHDLYTYIVELIRNGGKEYNNLFHKNKSAKLNLLTHQFTLRFCSDKGAISWPRVVEENRGNWDIETLWK